MDQKHGSRVRHSADILCIILEVLRVGCWSRRERSGLITSITCPLSRHDQVCRLGISFLGRIEVMFQKSTVINSKWLDFLTFFPQTGKNLVKCHERSRESSSGHVPQRHQPREMYLMYRTIKPPEDEIRITAHGG